ncbi:hypothetical protein R3P38DRAFT_3055751 [Favolaschia claudopus]|uniref:DUF7918 domain-containing protein n=1 Tax=Favolaschia claudopus TaxID=2862362 RepID=A0AAW0A404_9AGAR
MPQSHGFSAWIVVDDTPVNEFDVRVGADDTVSSWISSEVGKNFSIHWSNLSFPGPTGGRVLVDGHNCDGQILARKRRPTSTVMSGYNEGVDSVRGFVFSKVDVIDDDDAAFLETDADPSLGTIELEIWKVELVETSDGVAGPSIWTDTMAVPAAKKIHERSKKGITQQVGFADSVKREPVKVVSCQWTERVVTFSFKYRPLDLLRANGIAAPLPLAESHPEGSAMGASDEEDSDADEARLLERRLSAIRAKRASKTPAKKRDSLALKSEYEYEEDVGSPSLRPQKRMKLEDLQQQTSVLGPSNTLTPIKTETRPAFIDLTQPRKRMDLNLNLQQQSPIPMWGNTTTPIKTEAKPEFIDLTQPRKRIKKENRAVPGKVEVIDLTL